jgi:hypothetical protein
MPLRHSFSTCFPVLLTPRNVNFLSSSTPSFYFCTSTPVPCALLCSGSTSFFYLQYWYLCSSTPVLRYSWLVISTFFCVLYLQYRSFYSGTPEYSATLMCSVLSNSITSCTLQFFSCSLRLPSTHYTTNLYSCFLLNSSFAFCSYIIVILGDRGIVECTVHFGYRTVLFFYLPKAPFSMYYTCTLYSKNSS